MTAWTSGESGMRLNLVRKDSSWDPRCITELFKAFPRAYMKWQGPKKLRVHIGEVVTADLIDKLEQDFDCMCFPDVPLEKLRIAVNVEAQQHTVLLPEEVEKLQAIFKTMGARPVKKRNSDVQLTFWVSKVVLLEIFGEQETEVTLGTWKLTYTAATRPPISSTTAEAVVTS